MGQRNLNRVYSNTEFGELQAEGSIRDQAVGATISNPNILAINSINPALLVSNPFTSFEMGFYTEVRNTKFSSGSLTNSEAGLNNLAFSFPIWMNKVQTGFQFRKYSIVSYKSITNYTVDLNDSIFGHSWNEGEGGISQVNWLNSIKIFKNLQLGVTTGLKLGQISNSSLIYINNTPEETVEHSEEVEVIGISANDVTYSTIRGMNTRLGINYVVEPDSSKFRFGFGAILDLNNNINQTKNSFQKRGMTIGGYNVVVNDTIEFENEVMSNGPTTMGLGAAMYIKRAYVISADWKKIKFNDHSSNQYFLGVERFPKRSSNNVFDRSYLQFGIYQKNNIYKVNDQLLDEVGINFGMSVPLKGVTRRSPMSLLSIGMSFGTLGNTNNGLAKETTARLNVGLTFNNKWFDKIRIR